MMGNEPTLSEFIGIRDFIKEHDGEYTEEELWKAWKKHVRENERNSI